MKSKSNPKETTVIKNGISAPYEVKKKAVRRDAAPTEWKVTVRRMPVVQTHTFETEAEALAFIEAAK